MLVNALTIAILAEFGKLCAFYESLEKSVRKQMYKFQRTVFQDTFSSADSTEVHNSSF